jgi:hypothetical protein
VYIHPIGKANSAVMFVLGENRMERRVPSANRAAGSVLETCLTAER